jgi:anhydro-N-acetylmuramic acid kinase
MNVLGIMSGTSLGSVDYALCAIEGDRVKLKELWAVDYPKALQEKLDAAARGDLQSWDFCQLHHDLGRFYAEHARKGRIKPQLVGVHGQTVFHKPTKANPATFQLGESAYLAERLKVPVVNNFRVADLASGGQGAPLATMFHKVVFGKPGKHICVNNLGGISNVTSLDAKGAKTRILAFDTGPANMLIDFAMRHFSGGKLEYDADGAWAARGQVSEKLLTKWMKHPYFTQKPPKSTGRELFGEPFFKKAMVDIRDLSKFDVVATFTEFTARSLALNYKLHLISAPDSVILAGGGASNPSLVERIRQHLHLLFGKSVEVTTSDTLDWPVQAIEPAAFALLAYLRFHGQPGNIPETTGANTAVLCGQLQ